MYGLYDASLRRLQFLTVQCLKTHQKQEDLRKSLFRGTPDGQQLQMTGGHLAHLFNKYSRMFDVDVTNIPFLLNVFVF